MTAQGSTEGERADRERADRGPAGARDRIRALDGLRTIAVTGVVLQHITPNLRPWPFDQLMRVFDLGYLGVQLFFALSGFLITRILISDRREGVPLRYFLARRGLRVFPAFYLLLTVLAFTRPTPVVGWSAAYLSNYWLAFNPGAGGPLSHSWTLAVEEHFYLLWPLLLLLVPLRRLGLAILAVLLPAVIAVTVWLSAGAGLQQLVLMGTQTQALTLILGGWLAVVEARWRGTTGRLGLLAGALVVFGFAIALAGGFGGVGWPRHLGLVFGSTVTATATVVLVVRSAERRGWLARLLETPPMVHLGVISYGLYLYHLPIFFGLTLWLWNTQQRLPDARWLGVGLLATWLVSEISWRFWERPFLRLKDRFAAPREA